VYSEACRMVFSSMVTRGVPVSKFQEFWPADSFC
jgi:hypothetical protein